MMNTLGLHLSAVAPSWDVAKVERQMERLAEAGVGLLEIPLSRPQSFDAAGARGFARRWNVELFFSLAPPPALDVLEQPQEALDFLEPALRVCAEAGSFGLGGLAHASAGHTAGRPATQQALDRLSRFTEQAARLARPHGVMLGLKPASRHETSLLNRAAQAAWLIERVGAENLFVALDTAAVQSEEDGIAAAFETAAPFLRYLTAAESHRGIPGRGQADWPALFKALAATGYPGPLTLEAASRGDAALPAPWRAGLVRIEELTEEGVPFLRETARAAGVTLGSR